MKTVIMAGGRGTRIRSIAKDIPKPMIKINGIPVLEHEIRSLKKQGFNEIIITVSYMASVIKEYFGNGSSLGVDITYFEEEQPLGNAGALFLLRKQLDSDFLLINSDVMFDVDFSRFVDYHKKKRGLVTLFTHPNSHPFDSALIAADQEGRVEDWFTKEEKRPYYYKNRVNAGLHIMSPMVLDMWTESEGNIKQNAALPLKVDLDRQILKPLAGTGKMFCYDSPEYVKDMGTPERFFMVEKDFISGVVNRKNLLNKQKAVFLDRDGTINIYKGFLTDIESFELVDGIGDAICRLNEEGYLVIVVTNQPVVARGELSFEKLHEIHRKMETMLGLKGAYLDGIYVCPHHPDKGYIGEISELKIDCECRKPKPGLLLRAANDFNVELEESWMIGDSENDIEAGRAAGCKTVFIGSGDFGQDLTVGSVKEFVENWI